MDIFFLHFDFSSFPVERYEVALLQNERLHVDFHNILRARDVNMPSVGSLGYFPISIIFGGRFSFSFKFCGILCLIR